MSNRPVADVDLIRDLAAKTANAKAFDSLFQRAEYSVYGELDLAKAASAEDPELFKTAASLSEDVDGTFTLYETMGGKYKAAFGAAMFTPSPATGAQSTGQVPAQTGMPKASAPGTAPRPMGGASSAGGTAAPTVGTHSQPSATKTQPVTMPNTGTVSAPGAR